MKKRLAILDADILYDPLRESYGSYGQMFLDLLADWRDGWQMQVSVSYTHLTLPTNREV